MKVRFLLCGLLMLAVACPAVPAAGEGVDIDGYFKNFQLYIEPPQQPDFPESSRLLGANITRARFESSAGIGADLRLFAAYTVSASVLESSLRRIFNLSTANYGYRMDDIRPRIYPSPGDPPGSFRINQNLDRLYIAWSGAFDLYLGRQPFGWGAGKVINPTDVLAPFRYDELDREERAGLDAVRLIYPLGTMSELDAGAIAGADAAEENSAAYVRGRTYLARTDLSATLIRYRDNWLAGFDAARSVGGSGVWLEGAYNRVEDRSVSGEFLRLTAGWDRAFFRGRLYCWCEYHFNGAGAAESGRYHIEAASNPAFRQSGVFLIGRHYLFPGLRWQFTPLIGGACQLFFNMADRSVLLAPAVEYNIGQNLYAEAGGYLGFGNSSESGAVARSEFGEYGRVLYFSMRYYY
jgi:hypothetical protein